MDLVHCVMLHLLLLCACTLCHCALVAPPPLPGRSSGTAAAVQVGFYSKSCPRAEDVVRAQVQKRFLLDKTITPALLRMLFHDSFVRGADGSILLDSTPGHEAEKEALPNLTIRGFDLINEAKDAVEAVCPGVVSCADILVLAVRDSVALAGGPKYEVPTGRLDGKISIKEEALNLPSPAFPVEQSAESFRQKGLDIEDMVVLLGAHTVGVALCGFFNDRLFNFHGTGMADPTMNPQLVTRLSGVCPNPFFTESNADPPIDLDQSTPAVFDVVYYTEILAGNGILQIDQAITDDPSTVGLVHNLTSQANFFPAFVKSIIKMGNIEVITGNNVEGEVRRKCNAMNAGAVRAPVTAPTPPVTKPAPPGRVSKPPAAVKPAPASHVSKPPGTPAPGAPPVTKPAPAGRVSKPPVAVKPAPAGHVSKPPGTPAPATRTPPGGHVSKPPATTPAPAKPGPAGHFSKPPATTPAPAKPGPPAHVSKPPAAGKPTPPGRRVSKPPVAVKPAPPGHVSKPPATGKPGHVSKPIPPAPKSPAPPKRTPVRKAPVGHVLPPSKPAPPAGAGKSPIPKPPLGQVSKPPATPAAPGHVRTPPVGPVPPT